MYVAVIGSTGKKLQPTSSYRARKLLNSKRAVIHSYRPIFTIKLLDREDGQTQPIKLKDTKKVPSVKKIHLVKHIGGWKLI